MKQKLIFSPAEELVTNKYADPEKVKVFGADGEPATAAAGGTIWPYLANIVAALGTGVSNSIGAANTHNITETRNIHSDVTTTSNTLTPLVYVGVALAVAAVCITAILVFGKRK